MFDFWMFGWYRFEGEEGEALRLSRSLLEASGRRASTIIEQAQRAELICLFVYLFVP